MMNFFKDFKNRISKQDSQPVYRQYSHGELKIIAMRTRIIFEDMYKKQSMKITQADNQFKKIQASQGTIQQQYEVLQQIGKKVIETQMLKLYIEILRKIQAYAPQLINTKGDVALMKQQIKWFQCILWYRRCKKLNNIDEFNTFCWNFFKGVDITMELNLRCELFKVYEGLQYLDDDLIIPMDFAIEKIIPYVSFQIDQQQLDEMKKTNGEEIRRKEQEQKRKNMEENPFYKIPVNQPITNELPKINIPNNNFDMNNQPQYQFKRSDPLPAIPQHPNFHPTQQPYKSTKEFTQVPTQDDQFAIDPYSRVRKPNPNPNKSFNSKDLNLIDWQAMYSKEKTEEQNPYSNNSQIGLLNPDYSVSSEENSYDETSLPYPPSGVISVEDIGKKDQFFIDTLPCYEPKPVQSHIGFMKKPQQQNKPQEDSFINSIENQFFSNHSAQHNSYQSKPINPSSSFNQQDLLNESSGQEKKPAQNVGTKSLNRLFGFKFKSNLNQQSSTEPKPSQFGSNSQNDGQTSGDLSYSKSNQNEIDDLLSDFTLDVKQKHPQHKIDSSDIDDILSQLNNNSTQQQNINPPPNRFSVDEMLRDLSINQAQSFLQAYIRLANSNQAQTNKNSNTQNQKDNEHLDEDIKSLIESHKKQLNKQSSKISSSSSNEFQQIENAADNQEPQFTPYQYPDDSQRFNDSKIKFSQEMELLDEFQTRLNQDDKKQTLHQVKENKSNPQLPHQVSQEHTILPQNKFDYSSLDKDLFDSLKIIKNHYGQEIPSQNQGEQNQKSQSKSIKKPYMVSIYARKQYMDGTKLAKHQSFQ